MAKALSQEPKKFNSLLSPAGSRGAGTILFILILSALSILYLYQASEKMLQLRSHETANQVRQTRDSLQNSLEIIFSRTAICSQIARLSGADFSLLGLLNAGDNVSPTGASVQIASMQVTGRTALGGGINRGTFVVNLDTPAPVRPPRVTVRFGQAGSAITSCQVERSAQVVCEGLGYSFNMAQSRCEICESLGGTWSGTKCVI